MRDPPPSCINNVASSFIFRLVHYEYHLSDWKPIERFEMENSISYAALGDTILLRYLLSLFDLLNRKTCFCFGAAGS